MTNARIGIGLAATLMSMMVATQPAIGAMPDVPPRSYQAEPSPYLQPAIPVGPVGAWAPYRDAGRRCAVSRNYGTVEKPVTISVVLTLDGETVVISVATKAPLAAPLSGEGRLTLSPGISVASDFRSFDVPGAYQHVSNLAFPYAAFDGLKTARTVTIQGDAATTAPAADVRAAIEETDRCNLNRFAAWGIDPKRFGRGRPAPRGNPGAWFGADAYPAAALRAGESGRVLMVVDVSDDGRIASCRVVESAGANLDSASCQVMLHGHYMPATDSRGKPVASQVILPVQWSLPGTPLPPGAMPDRPAQ